MFALNALASSFLSPVTSLVGSAQQIQIVRAHFERLADVSTAEHDRKSPALAICPSAQSGSHSVEKSVRFSAWKASPWV